MSDTLLTLSKVFDEHSLESSAYFRYSEQFLQPHDLEKLRADSLQDNQILRAQILSHSGIDPFSPPRNSLEASGQKINPKRVLACFARAHYLYTEITKQKRELAPARLYKLGWAKEATAPGMAKLELVWGDIKTLKTVEQFDQQMKEIMAVDQVGKLVGEALVANKDSIIRAVNLSSPVSITNALKPIYTKIKKDLTELLSFSFFRSGDDYKTLQAKHAVYDPGDDADGNVTHSWGTNLTWTLAHIKQGNAFIVCSDILSNQYRAGFRDTPSAFFREICVALKAGYTLHVNSPDDITLTPDGLTPRQLEQLDSTGAPGNGINPSFEEIDEIFAKLEVLFREKKPFKYKYGNERELKERLAVRFANTSSAYSSGAATASLELEPHGRQASPALLVERSRGPGGETLADIASSANNLDASQQGQPSSKKKRDDDGDCRVCKTPPCSIL